MGGCEIETSTAGLTPKQATASDLIEQAAKLEPEYRTIMAACSAPFEKAAMMHSELLMVLALFRGLDCINLIESGRHLGHSTEVLSHFGARSFASIELKEGTVESAHAESKLWDRPVELLYGDATQLLPPMIDGRTFVLIDGPKGREQLRLAVRCLEAGAPAVAMHDMADWSETGKLLKKTGLPFLSSGDRQYVHRFQHLDAACWERKRKWYDTEPYVFRGRKVSSYGATVSAVFPGDMSRARKVLGMVEVAR